MIESHELVITRQIDLTFLYFFDDTVSREDSFEMQVRTDLFLVHMVRQAVAAHSEFN